MKKVGIVSCDKWINKIDEDKDLKEALINLGIDTEIISWQKPIKDKDLLVIRSVWGYQDYYEEFKKWLTDTNIPMCNNKSIILDNIRKDKQFAILDNNGVEHIETKFLSIDEIPEKVEGICVVKPSISGSGDNTFIVNSDIKNSIKEVNIKPVYRKILMNNPDCRLMIQPYINEINDGEYSCIFINGELTHTMKRFPSIFHDKKKAFLIEDIPKEVIELARRVERIEEYKGYLYMRVDMVLVNNKAKIMEVELAEPDLLTRNIDNPKVKSKVINTFAREIKNRI